MSYTMGPPESDYEKLQRANKRIAELEEQLEITGFENAANKQTLEQIETRTYKEQWQEIFRIAATALYNIRYDEVSETWRKLQAEADNTTVEIPSCDKCAKAKWVDDGFKAPLIKLYCPLHTYFDDPHSGRICPEDYQRKANNCLQYTPKEG